ncbi:hypothetical protein HYQ46_013031 [Verticillium longisporum]|nr:hypothetical protein HYQ46_013031 [Verticillium longisporum]
MVLSFKDEAERLNFHTLLTGTAVQNDETIYADVPLVGYTLSHSLDDSKGLPGISKLPWQSVRVINDDHGGDDMPPTVLSDKLRVIVDSKVGTIADRVNVETGELRVRLEVSDAKTLVVLRRPQNDVTMAVSDSQVGRESPKEMEQTLQMLQTTQSIRTFKFPSLKDLHAFQAALTGFQVKYDTANSVFDSSTPSFRSHACQMIMKVPQTTWALYASIFRTCLENMTTFRFCSRTKPIANACVSVFRHL